MGLGTRRDRSQGIHVVAVGVRTARYMPLAESKIVLDLGDRIYTQAGNDMKAILPVVIDIESGFWQGRGACRGGSRAACPTAMRSGTTRTVYQTLEPRGFAQVTPV
jgi:hypothetical protein